MAGELPDCLVLLSESRRHFRKANPAPPQRANTESKHRCEMPDSAICAVLAKPAGVALHDHRPHCRSAATEPWASR